MNSIVRSSATSLQLELIIQQLSEKLYHTHYILIQVDDKASMNLIWLIYILYVCISYLKNDGNQKWHMAIFSVDFGLIFAILCLFLASLRRYLPLNDDNQLPECRFLSSYDVYTYI